MALNDHGEIARLLLVLLIASTATVYSSSSSSSSSSSRSATAEPAMQSNSSALPSLVMDDSDMGIQMYEFPVVFSKDVAISGLSFKHSQLRVYVRLFCSDRGGISIQGFGGLVPSTPALPAASYFYKQPSELQSLLKLSVSSSSSTSSSSQGTTGGSWRLWWRDTITHKSDMGFWPISGPSSVTADSLSLQLRGSSLQHLLHLPECNQSVGSTAGRSSTTSTSSSETSTSRGSSRLGGAWQQHGSLRDVSGIWNVITTTDPNLIPAEKMARLLLLHSRYHQRLGFQGTILRCNKDEAHVLAALPQLKTEIRAEKLIIWPWNWGQPGEKNSSGHAVQPQPYFWQVPRNQITLLAGYGRRVQLSYLDMDEYLVLPGGGNLSSSQCQLRPTLDEHFGVTTLVRYPGLCSNCSGDELECWEAANRLGARGGLQVTQCPCLLGKPVLTAGKVLNTRVHKAAPVSQFQSVTLEPHCAYVVHLQALISSNRPWDGAWDRKPRNDSLLYGEWVAPVQGSGVFALPPGQQRLLSMQECVQSGQEVLRRCSQA